MPGNPAKIEKDDVILVLSPGLPPITIRVAYVVMHEGGAFTIWGSVAGSVRYNGFSCRVDSSARWRYVRRARQEGRQI